MTDLGPWTWRIQLTVDIPTALTSKGIDEAVAMTASRLRSGWLQSTAPRGQHGASHAASASPQRGAFGRSRRIMLTHRRKPDPTGRGAACPCHPVLLDLSDAAQLWGSSFSCPEVGCAGTGPRRGSTPAWVEPRRGFRTC